MVRRRASDAGIETAIGCHTFRATGITDYLTNGGRIEVAQRMAGHSNAKATGPDDRRNDDISVGEVERIGICMQERVGCMATWLEKRIEAINICMGAGYSEAALALLYSGIDTLAFLSAPAAAKVVTWRDFSKWCDRYMVPFMHSAASGIDLYGARCGVLH